MRSFPIRIFKLSHYVDVVMECNNEDEAHNGARALLKAGKLEFIEVPKEWTKDKSALTLVITISAKVKKIRPGQDVRHLIGIPGKGSGKDH